MKRSESVAYAREVVRHEAAALNGLVERIDEEHFGQAVELILGCTGRVVVSGMGKAWLIGQKISATLASTGTPSHALHAAEALHGDLGRVVKGDVALLISNSGKTREVVELLVPLNKLGVPTVALTGDAGSPLANAADLLLHIGDLDEACPLALAPSTTTTAMLALGDALALTVMKLRGFSSEDYAFYHPGGSLGRKLMKVEEVMRKGERHAVIEADAPLREALLRITRARAGAISVVDADGRLCGIFTDGDLRRRLVKGASIDDQKVGDFMTRNPRTIEVGRLASAAAHLLNELKVDELPVVDADGRPVGIVDIQDILGTVG
ncbi:MAG: KpsF/GutQ family sugar-phosphate isomerase [Planctomycetota bacterium]|nr:MAG: KpsF/GutQ family sugar-phosphate isomerase [Planctomycetota bacterium]